MSVDAQLMSLRWRMARALTPRRMVESRGVRFSVQCESRITHYRWRMHADKEPETLNWIDEWLREGDTFFDIGSNIGTYSLYAAMRHPKIRIVSFEPEYANLHLLRDNVLENGLQNRVKVYALALGNRNGISQLHIQDATPGSALHTEEAEPIDVTLTGRPVIWREGILVMTLDSFCEQSGFSPQAVKLDVDGTEPRILEGAWRTLRSPELRSMMIEMPRDPLGRAACEQMLEEAGLRCAWRDGAGVIANQLWARPQE